MTLSRSEKAKHAVDVIADAIANEGISDEDFQHAILAILASFLTDKIYTNEEVSEILEGFKSQIMKAKERMQ